MNANGFVVVPNVVRVGLDGHPLWWSQVWQILAGWSNFEDGGVQTWVPAIQRKLDDMGARTRQGAAPCCKQIRRVIGFFRRMGWLVSDVRACRAGRAILGHIGNLTLGALLGRKKRECPSSVSKWLDRRSTGRKDARAGPVSKSSVQGIQAVTSIFNNKPVDKSTRPPTQAERDSLAALRGMFNGTRRAFSHA